MKNISLLRWLVVPLVFLTASCTTTVSKTELVPKEDQGFELTGKTISVLPVTIRPRPSVGLMDSVGLTFPEAETYRYAIITTLSQSGLFTEVKTDGDSDYSLSAEIIGERMFGGTNNVAFILVRYVLSDNLEESVIWKENLLSHFELSAEDVFVGTERVGKTFEGAFRDNMNQLDDSVAKVLEGQGV